MYINYNGDRFQKKFNKIILFPIAVLVIFAISIGGYLISFALTEKVKTTATITNIEESSGHKWHRESISISYKVKDATYYATVSNIVGKVGDKIEIYYEKKNPQHVYGNLFPSTFLISSECFVLIFLTWLTILAINRILTDKRIEQIVEQPNTKRFKGIVYKITSGDYIVENNKDECKVFNIAYLEENGDENQTTLDNVNMKDFSNDTQPLKELLSNVLYVDLYYNHQLVKTPVVDLHSFQTTNLKLDETTQKQAYEILKNSK